MTAPAADVPRPDPPAAAAGPKSSRSVRTLAWRIPSSLRRIWLLLRLRALAWRQEATLELDIPRGVRVGRGIRLEVGRKTRTSVRIHPSSTLGDDIRLRLRGGSITMGPRVDIRAGVVLNVGGGDLWFEGPNNLAWSVTIHCAESVRLERFAHVAEYSTIVDSSHFYTSPDTWSFHNTRTAPVVLGVDVWVCPKSTVTSGVTIGDHTIVGANSVVVKDAPSGVLLSGVPATVVRELDLPWRRRS